MVNWQNWNSAQILKNPRGFSNLDAFWHAVASFSQNHMISHEIMRRKVHAMERPRSQLQLHVRDFSFESRS